MHIQCDFLSLFKHVKFVAQQQKGVCKFCLYYIRFSFPSRSLSNLKFLLILLRLKFSTFHCFTAYYYSIAFSCYLYVLVTQTQTQRYTHTHKHLQIYKVSHRGKLMCPFTRIDVCNKFIFEFLLLASCNF